jgi:glycerol uptake facilitator-like aquaporin
MKNERSFYWFMLGFFLGGIMGILIHDLVIKGVL